MSIDCILTFLPKYTVTFVQEILFFMTLMLEFSLFFAQVPMNEADIDNCNG